MWLITEGSAHSHSCFGHFLCGLLQCTVHGAALEEHWKVAIAPEYSSMSYYGHLLICWCDTFASHTALALSRFLGAIQDSSCHLSSPADLNGMSQAIWETASFHLPLSTPSRRTYSKSCQIKECYLTGLGKHAFSVMASALYLLRSNWPQLC